MAICTRCSAALSENAAFCTNCGETRRAPFSGAAASGASSASRFDPPVSAAHARGFLASLFDFSFTHFITGKLIKLLYILAMAIAGLFALAVIVSAFNVNKGLGMLTFILSPIVFLILVAYSRVGLEIIMVVFRIEEHLADGRKAKSVAA